MAEHASEDWKVKRGAPESWFEVHELPCGVWALREPGHIQDVSSFLILGSAKALVFDTGMGIGNIRRVVQQLTDLELVVVNSHSHFDHVGGNWLFPAVHIFDDDYAVKVLAEGYSHQDIRFDCDPSCFKKALPAGFDPGQYQIEPTRAENIIRIKEGKAFDLGSRLLEVIHTPGHSQDSISLLDQKHKMLFTGDIYGEWNLAFFDGTLPKFGKSNLEEYAASLRKLAQLTPDLRYLCPSHGDPLQDPGELTKVSAAFESVLRGDQEPGSENFYGKARKVYSFEGFSIWV
jgi:glyoxylase-like metal-dependent hydrolase (beta-lactamase superfamily II)